MKVTGFDQAQMTKAGYSMISPSDGPKFIIKTTDYNSCNSGNGNANTRSTCYKGKSSPANTVGGTCGDSYLYMSGTATGNPYGFYWITGFDLNSAAVAYGWQVDFEGPTYSYTKEFGGGLDFQTHWDPGATIYYAVPAAGEYYGFVDTSNSYAVLAVGDVCTSNGPVDQTSVF